MSTEDLEQYESELELQLYREYKDVVGIFTYAVETERRFYLCNAVDLKVRTEGGVGEDADDVLVLAVQLEFQLGLVLLKVLGAHVRPSLTVRPSSSSSAWCSRVQ